MSDAWPVLVVEWQRVDVVNVWLNLPRMRGSYPWPLHAVFLRSKRILRALQRAGFALCAMPRWGLWVLLMIGVMACALVAHCELLNMHTACLVQASMSLHGRCISAGLD